MNIRKHIREALSLNESNARFLVHFKDGTKTTIKVPLYALNVSRFIRGSFKKEIESFEKIETEEY